MKLGFMTGTIDGPAVESKYLPRWIRCDEMVSCWILNSMKPEIANSFILTNSAHELWLEINDRYSHSNAPLLFQLKQELMKIVQGNSTVTSYYSKLKRCWDELQCLNAISSCTCRELAKCKCKCKVIERVLELENQDRLLHFLINLNPDFDGVKSQILTMDPLSVLNKAYYLVLQVEKSVDRDEN